MIDDDILTALQTAALAAAVASSKPNIAVKAVGRTVTETPDGLAYEGNTWLEFIHIPNNRSDDYWGDDRVAQGTFRILLHWPNKDNGLRAALNYLGEIGAQFSKSQLLRSGAASVQIIQNPDISGEIGGGTELILPLTLQYRCFGV